MRPSLDRFWGTPTVVFEWFWVAAAAAAAAAAVHGNTYNTQRHIQQYRVLNVIRTINTDPRMDFCKGEGSFCAANFSLTSSGTIVLL